MTASSTEKRLAAPSGLQRREGRTVSEEGASNQKKKERILITSMPRIDEGKKDEGGFASIAERTEKGARNSSSSLHWKEKRGGKSGGAAPRKEKTEKGRSRPYRPTAKLSV